MCVVFFNHRIVFIMSELYVDWKYKQEQLEGVEKKELMRSL
jgi:hypothetical protein